MTAQLTTLAVIDRWLKAKAQVEDAAYVARMAVVRRQIAEQQAALAVRVDCGRAAA